MISNSNYGDFKKMIKKRVGVLLGGLSSEREVSLNTGAGFVNALKKLDYPYVEIDPGPDLPSQLKNAKMDCALLALHGKYGEDGTVQGILEYLKIPYTGSGVLASALAMNKVATKQILSHWGVPTPEFQLLDLKKDTIKNFKLNMPLPVVVKPAQEGSSVGMTIVKDSAKIYEALELAAKYDKVIIVEKFIPGQEIAAAIFMGKALPMIEIKPKSEWYDYKRKYTAGQTDYVVPAPLPKDVEKKCEQYTLETFRAVGCRQYARVDLRVTPDGKPYVLEINTLPGCTETSLLPKAAAKAGITFEKMIETLVENATLDYA